MFGEDKKPKQEKVKPTEEKQKLRSDGKKRIESCLELTLSEGCQKAYILIFEIKEYPQINKVMNALGYRKDFITFDNMVQRRNHKRFD